MNAVGVPAAGGLLDALRAVAATLKEMVRVRGALLAVELREEMERRKHMVLLAAVGAACLHMALVVFTFFVVAVFWETYRTAAIGAMAAFYLGCAAAAFLRLRFEVSTSPAPFAASRSELERDFGRLGPSP